MVSKNLGIKFKTNELFNSKCNKRIGTFINSCWTVNFKHFIRILVFYYEGRPKNNWNLNVTRELEAVARCAATCRESTQYSSSLPPGVSLG
jgi:hypothetical protein